MEIIQQGMVTVDGKTVTEPSTPVTGKEKIAVNGRPLGSTQYIHLMLNKPAGYVTTRLDKFAEKTVFDLLPPQYRGLAPVGRLDKDTEGLLLLTNDGDLNFRLSHPKFEVKKTYFVRMIGELTQAEKRKVEQGVIIDGEKTFPARIGNVRTSRNQTELTITIHEGRKRQVRRMFAAVRRRVIYLKRLSQGPLHLGDLKPGAWRDLSRKEIQSLRTGQEIK